MSGEPKPGELWKRDRDGMLARIESVEPGTHGYIKWRPQGGGRLRWNWKWEIPAGFERIEEPIRSHTTGSET